MHDPIKEYLKKGSVYVIAEAGVNHNGSLELAKQMVLKAKECGADCIKFQTFSAKNLVTKNAQKAQYQVKNTGIPGGQFEMLKSLELSEADFLELKVLCDDVQIEFMSTPYNFGDVDLLERIGVSVYKVASAMLVEPIFLKKIAKTNKPVILSTGMATIEEICEAVNEMKSAGNESFYVLQCTTDYPAGISEANISTIETIRKVFNCPVGFSDHTTGDIAAIVAASIGACIIEKHFTLDKSLPGPDQINSLEPKEFKAYVRNIKSVKVALGSKNKKPTESEMKNMKSMRRSIVSAKAIKAGEVITAEHLTLKRPCSGIEPKDWSKLIGAVSKADISSDEVLFWHLFN